MEIIIIKAVIKIILCLLGCYLTVKLLNFLAACFFYRKWRKDWDDIASHHDELTKSVRAQIFGRRRGGK